MTKEDSVLLCLIRISQFKTNQEIDFSDVDMTVLYNEALQQSVLGLIAPEKPSEYKTDEWIKAQYQQKSSFILYCHAQDELKTLLDEAGIEAVEGHEFPMLPRLANGLVLLDHFCRHLKSAVGLRHAIDWMMYVNNEGDDSGWNEHFRSLANEAGSEKTNIVSKNCWKD